MAALSDWAENALLDWLMGGSSPTRPTNRYVALFTAAPSDTGGGTEVSGSGYARQAITCAAASGGATSNSGAISFSATGGNFGDITHVGIFDALTVGNLLWHGALAGSKTINDGDTLTFEIGDLDFTLA